MGGGDVHYLESLSDAITPTSLRQLHKEEQVPQEVLALLNPLKNQKYSTQEQFLMAIDGAIGPEQVTMSPFKDSSYTKAAGKFNGETSVKFLT